MVMGSSAQGSQHMLSCRGCLTCAVSAQAFTPQAVYLNGEQCQLTLDVEVTDVTPDIPQDTSELIESSPVPISIRGTDLYGVDGNKLQLKGINFFGFELEVSFAAFGACLPLSLSGQHQVFELCCVRAAGSLYAAKLPAALMLLIAAPPKVISSNILHHLGRLLTAGGMHAAVTVLVAITCAAEAQLRAVRLCRLPCWTACTSPRPSRATTLQSCTACSCWASTLSVCPSPSRQACLLPSTILSQTGSALLPDCSAGCTTACSHLLWLLT